MFTPEDVFLAYYACQKDKRGSASCIEFEIDFDTFCLQLLEDYNNRTYKISESIAFIVTKPRKREIFAASFVDRVSHHLADFKLRPLIEAELIDRTYNNRIGKGASACLAQLKADILEVSENYTVDCHIVTMDMKGFFMSLSKTVLVDMMDKFIRDKYFGPDKEALLWLVKLLLMDSPEKNCFIKSPLFMWDDLDPAKSLFTVLDDLGVPIGNLISQLLANFYLNAFDHFVMEVLGFKYYGRYVDDFYIISTEKERLLNSIPLMRENLSEVGITLHPDKFYFQHYSKGVEILGAVIKNHRTYIHNRTIDNAFEKIRVMTQVKREATEKDVSIINSYLGLMGAHSTYKLRKRLVQKAMALEGLSAPSDFKKVTLRNDLKEDYKIIQKLKQHAKTSKRKARSNKRAA